MADQVRMDVENAPAAAPRGNGGAGGGKPGAWRVAWVVIAIVVLGAVGWYALRLRTGEGAGSGATASAEPPPPMEVGVVVVRERAVELSPRYLGKLEASQKVEIRARINGFLEARLYEEGGQVEAGQLLYQIDRRPFEAELAVARARLANAEARQARATRQVERLQEAATRGAATSTELDEVETEERVAQAVVQLERARQVQAELDLGYTSIESPIAGVIGQSLRDAGSYVQAGQEGLLAVVQQIDPIYVAFSVSEGEILRWRRLIASGAVRQPEGGRFALSLELSDGSVYPYEGRLDFVGVQIEPTTGTSLMRGTVPNPEGVLKPGQFVRVTGKGMERLGAVLVPQRAVIQSPAGASVFVVGENSAVEFRAVELGEWHGDDWIITGGLSSGDRVVVDHLMMLRPGTPVRPTVIDAAAGPGSDPASGPAPRPGPDRAPGPAAEPGARSPQ